MMLLEAPESNRIPKDFSTSPGNWKDKAESVPMKFPAIVFPVALVPRIIICRSKLYTARPRIKLLAEEMVIP